MCESLSAFQPSNFNRSLRFRIFRFELKKKKHLKNLDANYPTLFMPSALLVDLNISEATLIRVIT